MAQSSRTFRIFVSSTFSDLKAERNALQERVFPRLRELAAGHGCRFQAIDLRWGVSEEAARDQQTMKICLGEIERCQKTSPRPNFIILLGDRYGWRPLPYEVPADEFGRVSALVAGEEKSLLEEWYRRDDNAVPPVYLLQPRGDEFTEYENWEKVETALRAIFLSAAGRISLSAQALLKYTASATEQEIVAGALKVEDAGEHVFCFLREIQGLSSDAGAAAFRETDREAAARQLELKARLRQQLLGNVHEYTARWQGDSPSQEHLEQLCEDVYAELSKVILAEVGLLETVEPLEQEIAAHRLFGKERAHVFIGRAELLDAIDEYIFGGDPHPLAIWGASGSGKSALLAKAVEKAQQNGRDVPCRFIGATPESSNGRALLESLCRQISRRYDGDETTIASEYRDLVEEFSKRLALATRGKPLVLFLDALDQLSDADNARNLAWLPADLPPHVRLIVSTLPGDCLQALERKLPAGNRLEVMPMPVEDGKNILAQRLSGVNRQLQQEQEEYLLNKFRQIGLPLYLKLAFEEARLWKSYSGLPELSADIPGLLRDLFERLSLESNHGGMLVSHSLGYLAAGKNGLSEDELLDVLSMDQEVQADFRRRSPKSPKVEWLPVVVWSRLYFDLEPYLSERSADGVALLAFYHRQMSEAVNSEYLSKEEMPKRHQALARYFGQQPIQVDTIPKLRKLSEQPYQQAYGGMTTELKGTLTDFAFLDAKVMEHGPYALIEDYGLIGLPLLKISVENQRSLRLIQDALRLSAHVLVHEKTELAGQLVGRLLSIETTDIKILLGQIRESKTRPWLRPLIQSLAPAGGPLLHILAGHDQRIGSVAIAVDGKRALTANSAEIKVWDLKSGAEISTFREHSRAVTALAISLDGKFGISGSEEGILKIWNIDTGSVVRTWKKYENAITSILPFQDGRHFACIWNDSKALQIWDIDKGEMGRELIGGFEIKAMTLSTDGRNIIAGSWEGLTVWEIESGNKLRTVVKPDELELPAYGYHHNDLVSKVARQVVAVLGDESSNSILEHQLEPEAVALMPDGYRVVLASGSIVEVWDLQSARKLHSVKTDFDHINHILVTTDGRHILFGGRLTWGPLDDVIQLWDIEKMTKENDLEGHSKKITALAITSDSKWAISGSEDGTARIWDLTPEVKLLRLVGHTSDVWWVDVSPDGRYAFAALAYGGVQAWDLLECKHAYSLDANLGGVFRVAVTRDNRYVIAGLINGVIQVWDLRMRQEAWRVEATGAPPGTIIHGVDGNTITALATTHDSRFVVCGSEAGIVTIIDLKKEEIHKSKGHTRIIQEIACTPDSRYAITAGDDTLLKIWDLENGTEIKKLEAPSGGFSAVSITPDGRRIMSGSWDGIIRVWDLLSGNLLYTLSKHSAVIPAIAIFPDSKRAISASADGTLKLWAVDEGHEIFTLESHTSGLGTVKITANGQRAISVSNDGTIEVWDLEQRCVIASFTGADALMVGTLSSDGITVVVGGVGYLNILRLENIR